MKSLSHESHSKERRGKRRFFLVPSVVYGEVASLDPPPSKSTSSLGCLQRGDVPPLTTAGTNVESSEGDPEKSKGRPSLADFHPPIPTIVVDNSPS